MLPKWFPTAIRPVDRTGVPDTLTEIQSAVEQSRRLVTRRALMAAGVAVVPLPAVDWVTDIAVLLRLIPEINQLFGLTPDQVEQLAPDRRLAVYKAISTGGGLLVGKIVTRELVVKLLKLVGVRLTAQQAVKYVPLAGQAVSAVLTFSMLKYVCEQHIQQCAAIARQLTPPVVVN